MKNGRYKRADKPSDAEQQTAHAQLALLEELTKMLAKANTLEEIMAIRNTAAAMEAYARAANAGLEPRGHAAELKLRARRKAGKYLAGLSLHGGDRRSNRRDATPRLADLGVSNSQSKRWQRLASISEDDFAKSVAAARDQQREITAAELLRLAAQRKNANPPSESPASHPNGQADDGEDVASGPPPTRRELFAQLRHYWSALAQLLAPFADDPPDTGRRSVRYVLGELERTLNLLERRYK